MGEKHTSCSCYLQERELFKLAPLLGIDTLYEEVTPRELDKIERFITNRVNSNFDSETRTHEYAGVGINGAHALQVGLQLKPAEKPIKSRFSVVPSREYLEALEDFLENPPKLSSFDMDPSGLKAYGSILKFLDRYELTKCPLFSERDENIAAILNEENKSFVGLFGANHLGGIHKRLNNPNFLYVYISCRGQAVKMKESESYEHLKNLMGKVINDPRDCLKKMDDHLENDASFFEKSRHVYKSLIEDDREF